MKALEVAGSDVRIMPRLQPVPDEQMQEIYHGVLRVIEKIGFRVAHPEALELLAKAGCSVEDGSLVRIPRRLVEEAIGTAPKRIPIYDRQGNPALDLQGTNTYYGTGSDLPKTYDPFSSELRSSTAQDIANMARVVDYLPNIDFLMSYGIPFDRPNRLHYRYEFFEMVKNTTKPIVFTSSDGDDSRKIIEMAAVAVGGLHKLQAKPFILNYCQPISPLQHSLEGMGKILVCSELGIPINYPPGLMPGGTAPVTLAGAITLSIAEALSGLVIHQLKRPGSPIVLGGAHGCMDMMTTVNVYACPERLLTMWVLSSFYQSLGIPTWGFGGCSDAQSLDEQAGMEFAMLDMWASMTGVNLAHDTGYLGSGMIGALEAIVFNDEIISYTKHVMRGIEVNDQTLALDAIERVGPGGHYLDDEHTAINFRSALWKPGLSNRLRYDEWNKTGGKRLGERLNEKVRQILSEHQPKALSEEQIAQIEAIINS